MRDNNAETYLVYYASKSITSPVSLLLKGAYYERVLVHPLFVSLLVCNLRAINKQAAFSPAIDKSNLYPLIEGYRDASAGEG